MGLSHQPDGRKPSYGRRLRVLAAPLAPERLPFWVAAPRGRIYAQGWWWTPHGLAFPVFLGHNHIKAEMALLELREQAEPEDE